MRDRRARGVIRALAGLLSLWLTGPVAAEPFRPAADDEILERVPARSALEQLAPLRAAVRAHPNDLDAALALARAFIELGRRESDPRFVAYAESTLGSWLARPAPPEPVLVLHAIALQYLHRFDAALTVLDRALALQPLDGQAWLTRAALLELRGDYASARRACAHLVRSADELTALACLTGVDGRSGHLASSYAALTNSRGRDPRLPAALRGWVLSLQAEMAERLGDDDAAARALQDALASNPGDPYLKATYADLLLRFGRPQEVLALLAGDEASDPLLLRLAIAGRRAAAPGADRWASLYRERMSAASLDGDVTHLRERALFLLDVDRDPGGALRAAADDWAVQREPVDLRIYLRAALATGSAPDRAAITAWIANRHYEDRVLGDAGVSSPVARP